MSGRRPVPSLLSLHILILPKPVLLKPFKDEAQTALFKDPVCTAQ
jgi:hypothetical protein